VEESLYVHNAGLVIITPFLTRYFDMLGMLKDQVFPDEETAARAVLLLEYLVSGRNEVAEHELVFNKVLCGLPIETPVPSAIALTEHEIEISNQVMNAVLQNWDKMSNSTVANLQGSFLLRNGLLLEHEEHWSLRVESAGYDVLLSFLPWTISVIRLPWMAQRVEVDWETTLA
jgi:hypothetical protein